LAALRELLGKYTDAEPRYQTALAIMEKVHGKDHPVVATILNNVAWLYAAQGKYANAERCFVRALAITEESQGKDHPFVATILNNSASSPGVGSARISGTIGQRDFGRVRAGAPRLPEHPAPGTPPRERTPDA
ncbi:MAG: tetratricopeptide repeat protein, partial [Planctomycetes bacterium]|nr:tetratricopeptide repeat protein [Planctomycetota bacterium]